MQFSNYYNYNFVSPEPIIALIREELKSYIDSGGIDDSIWSIYISKCLKKLSRGMYNIKPVILDICNSEARLPDDYSFVREAWLCTDYSQSYRLPSAYYQDVTVQTTSTLLDGGFSYCAPCANCETPDVIKAVYKTTTEVIRYFQQQYLLKPGNVHTLNNCFKNSPNKLVSCNDTFDIHGNKFVTNFTTGTVYLLYYSEEIDTKTGFPLIPDNYRIQEYIEAFIKQKAFEQLSNQIVDETYNQIQAKAQRYEMKADEAFILADIETKKQTIYQKHYKNKKTKNSLNKYNINW